MSHPDKRTMLFEDGHGKQVSRDVHMTLNAADFRGTPIYPWLVVAANPHLSASDIWLFLMLEAQAGLTGVGRSLSWIRRKRWMSQLPGTVNARGRKPNEDGKDETALAMMQAHPDVSARALVRLLAENGISRGKDWVWRNRCG